MMIGSEISQNNTFVGETQKDMKLRNKIEFILVGLFALATVAMLLLL